ncbi:MAG: amino acid ABC transporter substrate-binding protein [Desulfobacteraceae bacterium]|jgi:branched-chain amino acid transport system substrate-binding protein|nr:MAG: amino acid ABC transporter substrate-binding protein [Desulfobacteraceae bacterium]
MNRLALKLILVLFVATLLTGLSSRVFAQEPIVLGVPTSLGFLEGKEGLFCVNMAVDEINAAGGVKVGGTMRPFRVVAIDARGAEPGVPVAEVIKAHKKLILEDKANFIAFGSFRSEAAIACMDLVSQYKIPMLLGTAMSPEMQKKITEEYDKYKHTFRVCLNAVYLIKYLGGTMAYLNKQFGFTKVFIMDQDVAWARKTGDLMISMVFEKMGWQVVGRQTYPTGASDFSSGLMKAKAGGAQVILPIFDMPQSGILVKQWNSMKVPALMAGFISPLAGPAAWKTFDEKIDGAINAIFEIGNVPVQKVPRSVEFYQKYQKRYGKPIEAGHSPAPAYEMVYILKEAIERAGSIDGDAVVNELEKTDRQGAMGRIRFGKDHQVIYGEDPNETAMGCMIQWRKGKRIVVYPEAIAEGKIALPEGLKSLK